MLLFLVFYVVYITVDLIYIIKTNSKKDIKTYIIMSIITLLFAIYFYKVQYKTSFIQIVFKAFNISS